MRLAGRIMAGAAVLFLGGFAVASAQQEKGQQQQGQQQGQEKQHQAQQGQQQKGQPQYVPQGKSQAQSGQQQGQQGQQGQHGKPQYQPQSSSQPQAGQTGQQQKNRYVQKPQQQPPQSFGGVYHGGVNPAEPTFGGVHPSGVPQHHDQARSGFLQSRAHSWNDEHRSWRDRGGYTGFRIPDDRFRMYFGQEHFFRIARLPLLFVGGYPRFQYDGFWVTLMDPWPEAWPPDWYETDDVYLDYPDDGYYLIDRDRPGIAIAVTISF
jgi:hypothetical protein